MKTKTKNKLSKKVVEMPVLPEEKNVTNVSVAPKKFFVILALIVLLGGLVFVGAKKYKGLVIAGKVNGKVITRLALEKALNSRYGAQTLDDLASNVLVQQLAAENKVEVATAEVDKEITATEERLGGKEALTATLERMGYTQDRFKEEMRIQVLVRKLAEKVLKVEVLEDEITKFFQDNKTLFPGKTLTEVKEDIKQNLLQQKIQTEFATWFTEQKAKATIQSYL